MIIQILIGLGSKQTFYYMKKFLFVFLFAAFFSTVFSQTAGDLFVGAETSLTESRIVDLGLSPVVGYQFTDNFQAGVTMTSNSTENTSYNWFGVYGKWYPNSLKSAINDRVKPFVKANFGLSTTDSYTNLGASIGVTGFLSNWFCVEPAIGYSYSDQGGETNKLSVNLNCAIRL